LLVRPAVRIALLGLIIAAVVGVPAGAGARGRTPPRPHIVAQAVAGRAVQGGTLLVGVRVWLPRGFARRNGAPVASAVVHFASGDVTVDLQGHSRLVRGHRFGHRGWWSPVRVWRGVAQVPVAADEHVGRVKVGVTVTLGDGSVTVATWGRIRKAKATTPEPDPDPEQPCTAGCQEL
jgi:hypothetical protein